ncbi:tRNA (guanine-N(7)-)-methyltransferase [Alphaproteobacteria bacterium]|nr:tRNA (guanine-N(7)-)-methyltransferase [Alphaproteobacteria bacterium]
MAIIPNDEKFFGRIKCRKLTDRQAFLFEKFKDKLFISSMDEAKIRGFDVFLEIGFGSGEHIAQMALSNSTGLYIGCEPFINGVASLLAKIEANNIKNILIHQGDARQFIKQIPESSIAGAFLLFPDPWHKRRHIERRFIKEKTIIEMARILKSNACWRIATDHDEYQKWLLKNFNLENIVSIFSYKLFDNATRLPEETWPKTRYEKKASSKILFMSATKMLS